MTSGREGRLEPSRRDVLTWAVAGVAVLAAACTTGGSAPATSPTPSSTPPSGSATPPPTSSAPPSPPDWTALRAQLSGSATLPGDAGFDTARAVYNPRFASRPAPSAVVMCANADDVAACVRFAAAAGLAVRMRAGGHSYGGYSTGAGLVCDVTALKSVVVDTAGATATIGAGAALVDVYTGLAAQGVAIAAGSCPTVGFAGLTLGGGVGVLTRAYGLTCDAVRSVSVVTADGTARQVDASTDPDLFWALRGGGAGFGAVTAITVAVRPAPTVTTFFLQWPLDQAAPVLGAWQGWIAAADPQLWSTCKILTGPAADAPRVTVSGTWIGDSGQLGAQLAPLLSALAAPSSRQVNTLAYGDAMLLEAGCYGQDAASCIADALGPQKRQPFAATSSILATALPAAGIAAAAAGVAPAAGLVGIVEGGASFDSLGGAVASVGPTDTPFPYRSALATVQYTATWTDASADPAPFDAFVRAQRAGLAPWLGAAAYVNYADPSIADYGKAYWADNYPRLQQIKQAVDPQGVFTFEQSVKP